MANDPKELAWNDIPFDFRVDDVFLRTHPPTWEEQLPGDDVPHAPCQVILPIAQGDLTGQSEANADLRTPNIIKQPSQWDQLSMHFKLQTVFGDAPEWDTTNANLQGMPVDQMSSQSKPFTLSLATCIDAPTQPLEVTQVSIGPLEYVRNMLLSLALPPVFGFDTVVPWHSSTQAIMHSLLLWNGCPITGISLYTDGSTVFDSTTNQKTSAAAVFLLAHTQWGDMSGGFRAWTLAGTSDSQKAEHAAIVGAELWIIQILSRHGALDEVNIFSDCLAAGNAASGEWHINGDSKYGQTARSLHHFIQQHFSTVCAMHHVEAHKGNAFNEAVDIVAKAAAYEWFSTWTMEDTLAPLSLDGAWPSLLQWVWFLSYIEQHMPETLDLQNQTIRFDLAAPFKTAPQTSNILSEPVQDADPNTDPQSTVANRLELSCATANVLTLFPGIQRPAGFVSARQESLMRMMHEQGIHVCGIQETRSKTDGHLDTDLYHVLSSPATADGNYGVQMWIAKQWHHEGGSVLVKHNHLKILHGSSRRLVVLLTHPAIRLLFAVGHAPSSEDPHLLRKWWNDTSTRIPSRYQDLPFIGLFDANARVGSQCSEAVQDCGAEAETIGGQCFHEWMIQQRLMAPQTDERWHRGPGNIAQALLHALIT